MRAYTPAAITPRMPDLVRIGTLLQLAAKDRQQLFLENIALRQQLAVYKRSVKRPNIKDGDRIFWLTVMRMLKEWRQALVLVQAGARWTPSPILAGRIGTSG